MTTPCPEALTEIASNFGEFDDDALRLEMLMDMARRLPPLPSAYEARRLEGDGRVPECMTPVHLWVVPDGDDRMRLHVWVAPESPTIGGLLGVIVRAYDGAPREVFSSLPDDLVGMLHLGGIIRMNRVVGVRAMIERIRRSARDAHPQAGQPEQEADKHE